MRATLRAVAGILLLLVILPVHSFAQNGLVINSLAPSSGTAGTQVTISGANFGATPLPQNVSFNGVVANLISWNSTTIVVTVPPALIPGDTTVIVKGPRGFGSSNGANFTVLSPFAVGAGLQLSIKDSSLQVNLTSTEVLDWIHWGRISATLPDRKAIATPLISDYTALSGAEPTASLGNIAFSWSDGNHPSAVSEATEDVETFVPGSGFQITVPADTTVKTLNLYAEVFFGQGVLHASLSDGSAADINDQTVIDSDVGSKVYSIDFRAASAGQTLTVTFSGTASGGGVGLQAATLTPHLPSVTITSPTPGQQVFGEPVAVSLTANASQFDNQITNVKIASSEGTVVEGTVSPLNASLAPLPGGRYSVTASATDSAGLTSDSSPVEFHVIASGGWLMAERRDISSPVDLALDGAADWVLWGPQNTGDLIIQHPGAIVGRKSGVAPLISDYRPIGNHRIQQWSFANNIFFTDTTQNFSSYGSQLMVAGARNGYEITVPADTTTRTLQLYAGAASARAKLTAFLSDGSAPVVTSGFDFPDSGDLLGFPGTSVFAVTYNAASAGQTLTVRYAMDFDYGNGQIDLLGAALSGSSADPIAPAPQITSINPNAAPTNTKVTIIGNNFGTSQGASNVYFGGMAVQVLNWADTSINVVVPVSLADGSTAQVWVSTQYGDSNSTSFTVPAYQIFPSTLIMLVGETKTVSAKDSSHNIVSGLSWSTSDPSIVSVSTDDPALITGLAPGTATVYAGDVPFQVTVHTGTSLPPGTPLWSAPPGPGATGFSSLVPAVPSDSGVDVLALDDAGFISAFSADGEPLWRQFVSGVEKIIPDFAGNTLVNRVEVIISPVDGTWHQHHKISKVDPNTGNLTDFYTFAEKLVGNCTVFPAGGGSYQSQCFDDHDSFKRVIPGTSGILFVQENTTVTAVDMSANQSLGSTSLDQGTTNQSGTVQNVDAAYGQMIVAGDGNAYVPYVYRNETVSHPADRTVAVHTVSNLALLGVSPDGTSAKTVLHTWSADHTETTLDALPVANQAHTAFASHNTDSGIKPFIQLNSAITNADSGVAVFASIGSDSLCSDAVVGTYSIDGDPTPHSYMQTSGCGYEPERTVVNLAIKGSSGSQVDAQIKGFQPALQREDGSFIGTARDNSLAVVGLDGTPLWSTKINPDANSSATKVQPLYATADGGAIVTSTTTDGNGNTQLGTLYTVNQMGSVVAQDSDRVATYSWLNNWYALSNGAITRVSQVSVSSASTWDAILAGNPSGTPVATPQPLFAQLDSCNDTKITPQPPCPGRREAIWNGRRKLVADLKNAGCSSAAQSKIFDNLRTILV